MKIVIPGGSGQVGAILARHFRQQGHQVTIVSARVPSALDVVDGADIVINLAGRNVNCRYNAANRREIMESRVASTRAIGEAIAKSAHPPALWMNASTATIYRHALDRPMDEARGELGGNEANAPDTWRFSIDVAKSWERALFDCATPGTRKVALRSSMIMSPDADGVFDVLLRLVRFGLGGRAGSGEQYVSWIHDQDFVNAIDFLIADEQLKGSINVCSPNPLPNAQFMRDLRDAWGTSIGLPATSWMIQMGAFFLRTESELILKSRRVVPGILRDAGFAFQFAEWPAAAQDWVKRWRAC